MINKLKNTIILLFILIILSSCKGIEFEDSSFSHAVELTRGEAMILVADEKNNYEKRMMEVNPCTSKQSYVRFM